MAEGKRRGKEEREGEGRGKREWDGREERDGKGGMKVDPTKFRRKSTPLLGGTDCTAFWRAWGDRKPTV